MTIEIISIITQVGSLLLVSGSLVFVGMQMRQTHTVERANAQSAFDCRTIPAMTNGAR